MAFFRSGSTNLADYSLFAVNNNDVTQYIGTGSVQKVLPRNLYFNLPITIGKNVSYCDDMLDLTPNFNSTITYLGNKITSLNNLLKNTSYNRIFNYFPTNCENGSVNCCNFFNFFYNNPIIMTNSVGNCSNMLFDCRYFNSSIVFGNYVHDTRNMLNNCRIFNLPINLNNISIKNADDMFLNCTNFNQSVTFSDSLSNGSNLFKNCINLNQNIYFGSGILSLNDTFNGARNFNSNVFFTPLQHEAWTTRMTRCFLNSGYNQPFIIDLKNKQQTYLREMFPTKYNKDVQITHDGNGGEIHTSSLFNNCFLFNSNLNFYFRTSNPLTNIVLESTYANCKNFNKELNYDNLPVVSLYGHLKNCINFNSNVILNLTK